MRYGGMKECFRKGEIEDVIVVRIRSGKAKRSLRSHLSKSRKNKRNDAWETETNYRYVLIFHHAKRNPTVPRATDYFLFRDSKTFGHIRRDFRALHTVAYTIAYWGREKAGVQKQRPQRFTFLDLSGMSDEDAASEIVKEMTDRTGYSAILRDALVNYPLSAEKPLQPLS